MVAAWLVGRVASDRFLWSQLLFWIPTPLAIVASIVLIVAAIAMRPTSSTNSTNSSRAPAPPIGATVAIPSRARRWVSILGAAALVLTVVSLAREQRAWPRLRDLVRASAPPPREAALRILHCNLHWPEGERSPKVMAFLNGREEDLIVFTEPGWLLFDERGKALEQAGWTIVRTGRFAVLSRVPVIEARGLVRAKDTDITLLRVDASKWSLGELTIGLADMPSGPLLARHAHAELVRRLLDAGAAPPFDLVLGDLNNTRGAASFDVLFPGLRDAYDEAGRGIGGSWPATFPLWQIDHALLGPRLRALDYTLIDIGLSKHRAQLLAIVPSADERRNQVD